MFSAWILSGNQALTHIRAFLSRSLGRAGWPWEQGIQPPCWNFLQQMGWSLVAWEKSSNSPSTNSYILHIIYIYIDIIYYMYIIYYIYTHTIRLYTYLFLETTWLGCRAQMRPLMAPRWVLAYKVLVPALSLKKIPQSQGLPRTRMFANLYILLWEAFV